MRSVKTKFKKATSTPKGRIIVLSILLVIVAAIAGGIWYWNTHKKAIIRNELEKAINRKSKGLYKIKYENLQLDEIAGSLTVTNMSMSYDSNRYNDLLKSGNAPPVLLHISIPEISVTGVETPRALIDQEIVGRKLEIKNPIIDIMYTYSGKDSLRNTPTKEVYEQILGNLDLIEIDSVLITGGLITTGGHKPNPSNVQFQNISIALVNVQVDSAGNDDPARLLFSREINIGIDKIVWNSSNKLYNYTADSIAISSVNQNATIKGFHITPALAEDAFVRSLPTQDDRFNFDMNTISLTGIDLQSLFNEQIIADSMRIGSATFKIYRDLGLKRDKKNRIGTYPHQAIQKIPISMQIDKIVLPSAFVEYKERSKVTRQAGKVQFYNASAVITNFTNNKEVIEKNNLMTVDISSRFMNKTPLHLTWTFYLMNPKGRFDVKGSLGAMNAADISILSMPMGPARIDEGKIRGIDFDFKGHDYGMDGQVRLLYDDLKVTIMEKDEDTKEIKKKGLKTFAANLFIKNSNPKKNEEPRTPEVHFDRDTNRSIFHLAWKTLFKGIKETVGIKK